VGRIRRDVVFVHHLDVPEDVASFRASSQAPAALIGARYLYVPRAETAEAFLDRVQPEVIVAGKPLIDDRLTRVAEAAAQRGIPVATWLCDLHEADPTGERIERQCRASRALVVQTATMADWVKATLGREPVVIEECLQYPADPPAFAPKPDSVSLLWYGNIKNFDTLVPAVEGLMRLTGTAVDLVICAPKMPDALQARVAQGLPPKFRIGFVPWSRTQQLAYMRRADIIIVPSEDTLAKRVKGHNRVTDALNAGRVTVAFPLPQYRELKDYLILDSDIAAGVATALADPGAALARVVAGQKVVQARFGDAAIAAKWSALIDAL
jgi:hypothetical protein